MKNQLTIRNMFLSLTLGLFSFHLYVVDQLNLEFGSYTRGLASDPNCSFVDDFEQADTSDRGCAIRYNYDREEDLLIVEIVFDENEPLVVSRPGSAFSVDPEMSDEDLEALLLSYTSINEEGNLAFRATPAPSEETTTDTAAAAAAEAAEIEAEEAAAIAAEATEALEVEVVPAEAVETEVSEDETVADRFERLSDEFESLGSENSCSTESDELTEGERLVERSERYKDATSGTRLETANDLLDQLENFISDYEPADEVDENDPIAKINCLAIQVGESSSPLSNFNTELLPTIREHLASGGTLDGMNELEALASDNDLVGGALAIEASAFSISAALAANRAFIAQAQAAEVSEANRAEHDARIAAALTQNAELTAQLDSLRSQSGELTNQASLSLAHWGAHFGSNSIDIDSGNVARILEEGATPETVVGVDLEEQSPSSPFSGDVSSLDQFFSNLRQSIQSQRVALTGTVNRTGQNARRDRIAAPTDRVVKAVPDGFRDSLQ